MAIYRVDALKSVDGYDDELITAQDSELNMRLIKNGWQIWRSELVVYTSPRDRLFTMVSLDKKWILEGKLVKKHPTRLPLGEIAPWFGFLLTLSLFLLGVNHGGPPTLYLIVIFLAGIIESVRWKKP